MMLFLHGALGTAAQFEWLRPHLPPGWATHALQLPGHGGLPAHQPFSLPLFADAVLAFLEKQGIQSADFFGYSMGGYLALWMAAHHPQRVRKVLTLNTKLEWNPDMAARMGPMFDPEKIEAKAPQLAQALASQHAPADWRQVAARTADFLHDLGKGKGLAAADWASIECPVLLLRGDADSTVSAEETRQVALALPHGTYAELANSRHSLEQVDGVAVGAAAEAFFSRT